MKTKNQYPKTCGEAQSLLSVFVLVDQLNQLTTYSSLILPLHAWLLRITSRQHQLQLWRYVYSDTPL
jgi:hypothetical protein